MLRERERWLVAAHYREWFRLDIGPTVDRLMWQSAQLTYRRGFVEAITLACADLLQHAATIFSACPVREVRLADKRPAARMAPAAALRVCTWIMPHTETPASMLRDYHLPRKLFVLLDGEMYGGDACVYSSHAAAIADLSQAAVRYGRSKAKRPTPEEYRHSLMYGDWPAGRE